MVPQEMLQDPQRYGPDYERCLADLGACRCQLPPHFMGRHDPAPMPLTTPYDFDWAIQKGGDHAR